MSEKQQKGFTIVEVMIVLAIAGLIMLIVFLAVPALQRNSRNTALRNDAASVLGGVSEFVSNNNGASPTGIANDGTTVTKINITGGTGTQATAINVKSGTTVSAYAPATPAAFTAPTNWPAATGNVVIAIGFKCATNSSTTPTSRSVAALYRVESGSGDVYQCVDS